MYVLWKSQNKDKNFERIATFEFCKTLQKKAKEKKDSILICHVGDFSKLIAFRAWYHKACHSCILYQRR